MSAARWLQIRELSAKFFENVWNPTNARTGNKILRKRVLGPTLLSYYPEPMISYKRVNEELGLPSGRNPGDWFDRENAVRVDDLERRRRRGKAAPRKGILFFILG